MGCVTNYNSFKIIKSLHYKSPDSLIIQIFFLYIMGSSQDAVATMNVFMGVLLTICAYEIWQNMVVVLTALLTFLCGIGVTFGTVIYWIWISTRKQNKEDSPCETTKSQEMSNAKDLKKDPKKDPKKDSHCETPQSKEIPDENDSKEPLVKEEPTDQDSKVVSKEDEVQKIESNTTSTPVEE